MKAVMSLRDQKRAMKPKDIFYNTPYGEKWSRQELKVRIKAWFLRSGEGRDKKEDISEIVEIRRASTEDVTNIQRMPVLRVFTALLTLPPCFDSFTTCVVTTMSTTSTTTVAVAAVTAVGSTEWSGDVQMEQNELVSAVALGVSTCGIGRCRLQMQNDALIIEWEKQKQIRRKANEEKGNGKDVKIRYNKVSIDEVEWRWNRAKRRDKKKRDYQTWTVLYKNKDGELVGSEDEIAKVWKVYFEELLYGEEEQREGTRVHYTTLSIRNIGVLHPVKLSVDALSRKDATILTSEEIIDVLINKLESMENDLAAKFLEYLKKKIDDRRNNDNERITRNCTKTALIKFTEELYNRLFPSSSNSVEDDNQIQTLDNEQGSNTTSFEFQLKRAIETAATATASNAEAHITRSLIKKEFQLFESTGKKTPNLENLYKALMTIKPTSTENERIFSLSGIFVTKIRNRLSDDAINALVFLKAYFIKNRGQKKDTMILKMYELYVEDCRKQNIPPEEIAKKWLNSEIFNIEFNYLFKIPTNDTCDTCRSFQIKLRDLSSAKKSS
ncbi:hypothetical protein ILUMI_22539 [Ignelater luminosus]|uniref:HAT C-terminal dimerisation domain-containing protein n=1 Tax=Ignelater luminosus TaxID=2038154 RepID=A0A8K0CE96_IGNLU|nr:hypothetical protein ILUMI_22539 [Ignelater luminosus]